MYKFTVKTSLKFMKRLNAHSSLACRVPPHLVRGSRVKGLNVSGACWERQLLQKEHVRVWLTISVPYFSATLRRPMVYDGTLAEKNGKTVVTARLFSGRSDEKDSTEHKNVGPLSASKDGKENNSGVDKPGNQASESTALLENGQGEMIQSHECCSTNTDGQQTGGEKHPDSERKKDQKIHTTKKHHKKWSDRRKSTAEKNEKKLEDYDRLQLLKEKFIRKLGKRWIAWESITDTFDNFPYYISENTREVLLECAGARLKELKYSKFGELLPTSSHLILLHGQAGMEIYQETLVRALAYQLQASLLVLDSNFLSAKDINSAHAMGSLLEEEDDDDDKVVANEEWQEDATTSADAIASKALDDLVIAHPLKITNAKDFKTLEEKLRKTLETLEEKFSKTLEEKFSEPWKSPYAPANNEAKKHRFKTINMENNYWAEEVKKLVLTGREDELKKLGKKGDELKKLWHDLIIGDRVKFSGPKDSKAKIRSRMRIGQEGFVTSISDGLPWKVCVKFQGKHGNSDADEVFCDADELEKVDSSASDEAWLARFPELPIEALCKMVLYRNPVIVYFPDIQHWFARAAPAKERGIFLQKVGDLLRKVNGPVVFIASRLKEDLSTPNVNIGLESIFSQFGFETTRSHSSESDEEIYKGIDRVFKIFKNGIRIFPPTDPQLLQTWQKKLEEDKRTARKHKNHILLEKTLAHHGMACTDLAAVDTFDLQLTRKNTEKVIGWARNICLHLDRIQVNEGKLLLEKDWLERSLLRLKALKLTNEDKMSHVMGLAENDYEKSLMSSVILAHDVGVKFEEIGALEDVKSTLKELIVLPLQRPELFQKGNLRKPCKGVLLFGPPGTGKTLLAKAVATEAGANFINISASSITSKYYGDDEKLVKALFALAKKLCPVVIFIDEVDSLLGVRGGSSEHEATRRIKNEFMAAWDGLESKDNERILVLATTNRPFDLDDAVIRRLPRRLLVDLPNAENREKVLRIILAKEELDDSFDYGALAAQTEGYSGSDLKNLCVAAAYTPIREFLQAEEQGMNCTAVRPLCFEDFIQSKKKIGTSIAFDAASMVELRQWNDQYGEGGSRSQVKFGFAK